MYTNITVPLEIEVGAEIESTIMSAGYGYLVQLFV